jgi:hypothetical protein
MKQFTILLILVFFSTNAVSQDSRITTEELGLKVVSSRVLTRDYDPIYNNPALQFFDGFLYRVSKNRFALRLGLDIPWNKEASLRESVIFVGTTPRFSKSTDIKISLGGQYNLFKDKKWLYIFTDLYYRNIYSSGKLVDGYDRPFARYSRNDDFTVTNSRMGLSSGLGFKIKIFNHFHISPELFCDLIYSSVKTYVHDGFYKVDHHSFSRRTSIRPFARIFLTVDF